jgi:hypothetical protein
MNKFELDYYMLHVWGEIECTVFVDLKSFNFANQKKDLVRKSQIRKVSYLRKVRKSDKLFGPTNLRICDFWKLFAGCPSLQTPQSTDILVRKHYLMRQITGT